MPLAIFIVVIMGFFVATLARTTSQTAISTTQEAVSLQAFYAAESGAQLGMNRLYGTASLDLVMASASCAAINVTPLTPAFNVPGLQLCSATVSCASDLTVPGQGFYTITSTGQCGAGDISANRTIRVSARME